MALIRITDRAGQTRSVEPTPGRSLMEIIRGAGFDELLAICGGCCSCATCHIYVEAADGVLGVADEDEISLLEDLTHYRPNSRLSCQIEYDVSMGAFHISIAPVD